MNNLQGIIRKSANNALTQWEQLGYVANNLSNMNTKGYKTVRFEQLLSADGYLTGEVRTDYSQGSMLITSNPYDVAINGAGYIPVFNERGEVAYTRDGAFKQGKDGYLVTSDDWIVGNGIKIPSTASRFEIKPNGEVFAYYKDDSKGKKIGVIPLVTFDNPEGLDLCDNNKLKPTDYSGDAKLIKNHDRLVQNQYEKSNVSIFGSVTDMLRLNASMLASTKMMKVVDDMYNKSINIRES